MSLQNTSRGAARHWIIGCFVVVALIVLALGGGGYYMFKKVAPSTFDVTAKADPPADATPEQLLPENVGSYTRSGLGAPSPASGDFVSTGTKAIYQDASGTRSVAVIALPTDQMEEAQAGRRPGSGNMNMQPGSSNVGVSVKIPFGPMKTEIAMWSKPNWSYVVQTTNSVALDFAKQFAPVGSDTATTTTP